MADKYISQGISLWHGAFDEKAVNVPGNFGHTLAGDEVGISTALGTITGATAAVLIPDIQEFGDLGTGASAERDQIEVTTLADDKHVYTDGILADEGEKDSIDFKFLYTPESYSTFLDIIELEKTNGYKSYYHLLVPKKDGGYNRFTILGTSSVKLNGTTYNNALNITLTVTPKEEIAFDELTVA